MKIVYALFAAALLMLSIGSMMPKAEAIDPPYVLLRLTFQYTDGTSKTIDDSKPLAFTSPSTFSISDPSSGKKISSVTAEIVVQAATGDKVTNSASSIQLSVKKRDGNYYVFPQTLATINDYSTPQQSGVRWTVYSVTVTGAQLESIIGAGSTEFKSEIRAVTGGIAISGTFAGRTGTYIAQPASAYYSIASKPDGSTTDGGSGGGTTSPVDTSGTTTIPPPTGKIYSSVRIVIANPDGTEAGRESYLNNQLATFDIVTAKGSGYPIKSVIFNLYVFLDRDSYIMPARLSYANNFATDNWGASVDNVGVDTTGGVTQQKIERVGLQDTRGLYYLLRMEVDASQLQNLQTDIGIATTGKLQFYNRESTLVLTDSLGKQYNIKVPAENVVIDLTSFKTEGQGSGEIACEGTECEVVTDGFDLAQLAMPVMIGVAVVAAIGGGIALRKKKSRR